MTAPKPYHHGDLRAALLDLGLRVLAEDGRHGLSLRKVARLAGVSHNAPYMHFEDKEALLAAIAEQGFEQLETAMRGVLETTVRGSVQQLRQLGAAYVSFALAHPHSFGVMFTDFDRRDHTPLGEAAGRTFTLLAETVAAGQQLGVVRPGDPAVLAMGIWALMHGTATLFIARRLNHGPAGEIGPQDVSTVLMDLLYNGLRAEEFPGTD